MEIVLLVWNTPEKARRENVFESRPKVRERQTLPVIHPVENVHTSRSCVQKAKLQKTVVQV